MDFYSFCVEWERERVIEEKQRLVKSNLGDIWRWKVIKLFFVSVNAKKKFHPRLARMRSDKNYSFNRRSDKTRILNRRRQSSQGKRESHNSQPLFSTIDRTSSAYKEIESIAPMQSKNRSIAPITIRTNGANYSRRVGDKNAAVEWRQKKKTIARLSKLSRAAFSPF